MVCLVKRYLSIPFKLAVILITAIKLCNKVSGMSEKLYLKPNRKLQIGALFFILLCIVSPIFLKFLLPQITPDLNSSVEEFKEFHSSLKLIMNCTYFAFVICIIFLVTSTLRAGYLALKLGCFPPPDTLVPFRARMYKGKRAIFSSYISISLGILVGSLVVIQSFYMIPAINYSFGGY